NNQPVDLALAETVLKDLISEDGAQEITPSTIIKQTAEYFGLSIDELNSKSRTRTLVTARQIAMYLLRELTDMSVRKIGAELDSTPRTRDLATARHIAMSLPRELTDMS